MVSIYTLALEIQKISLNFVYILHYCLGEVFQTSPCNLSIGYYRHILYIKITHITKFFSIATCNFSNFIEIAKVEYPSKRYGKNILVRFINYILHFFKCCFSGCFDTQVRFSDQAISILVHLGYSCIAYIARTFS